MYTEAQALSRMVESFLLFEKRFPIECEGGWGEKPTSLSDFACALIPICAILDFYLRFHLLNVEKNEEETPRLAFASLPCHEDFCHKIIFYSYLS